MRKIILGSQSLFFSLIGASPAMAAQAIPADMSAASMFMNADLIVKSVMLLLIGASVTTWGIAIAKLVEFRRTARAISADQVKLAEATALEAVDRLDCSASAAILDAARDEIGGCVDIGSAKSSEAMGERLSIRLAAIEGDAVQSLRSGFSILASIGSVSPFVGLLGTVWGIMNSFIGISKAQTTNLAVVAPGIAEALLATALGLVAAIPAVLIYNILSRQMAGVRRSLHNVSARAVCLVSHKVERAQTGHLKIAC